MLSTMTDNEIRRIIADIIGCKPKNIVIVRVCDYEKYENRQGVTSETCGGDQVMLMGRNSSHMVCKMGCHCGLMEGAA